MRYPCRQRTFPCIRASLSRPLDRLEVLRFECGADSPQMIGELLVGQLVGFEEASIPHHRVHPFFRQAGPLLAQESEQSRAPALRACQS